MLDLARILIAVCSIGTGQYEYLAGMAAPTRDRKAGVAMLVIRC
jgi:hypothetical protein